jgi:hypothetical protein
MSATNRSKADGTKTEREPRDYYRTPAWATRSIHPYLPPGIDEGFRCVDAGAGLGAIASELPYPRERIVCVENDSSLAAQCRAFKHYVVKKDWLAFDSSPHVVVMNPPYRVAMEFVEHALERARGPVLALLRLPWLAGQARASFHRRWPAHVLVLPRRPSFTPDGKTDACDYGWFMWGANPGAERPIVQNRWDVATGESK